ncbi:MAG: hypothetical protein AAGI38_16195 [Bacteroidota bacterium]
MNKFLEDWMKELDELTFSLDMKDSEATELFEKQKATFRKKVQQAKGAINEMEGSAKEKAMGLKAELEHLEVQLALGKAETRDALAEQKKKVDEAFQQTETKFNQLKAESESTAEGWMGEMDTAFTTFRTKMDLFRLHLHLGAADAKDDFKEIQASLRSKVNEMKQKAEAKSEESEDKWEGFADEMKEGYSHMTQAVRKLFS